MEMFKSLQMGSSPLDQVICEFLELLICGLGGPYAFASARALVDTVPDMEVEKVARKSMEIASDICIYTNKNFVMETLEYDTEKSKAVV
jgi:ATP-dependent HslUV protease subunit HslV